MILAFIFGIILAIIHFFNEKINISNKLWRIRAVSFVAGVSVTYAFLELLPEAYKSFERLDRLLFIFIIMGFSMVHVIEKYFYKERHRQEELLHNLKELHSVSFFIYYFLLGVVLVDLSERGLVQAILFFFPIIFYAGVGVVAREKIHKKMTDLSLVKLGLSASTMIGVLIAPLLLNTRIVFDILFALIIGMFIYIALIDFMPREKEGEPIYFTAGVFLYTVLIALLIL